MRRITTGLAILAMFGTAPLLRAQAQGGAPENSTGQCGDGTWTMSATKTGACSSHNGVKKWVGKKPKGATARCTDGAYSMAKSTQGACSGHDGVATWYKKPAEKH